MLKNNFIFCKTKIDGVILVKPRIFKDERGYFMETYTHKEFVEGGIESIFVQDNQSKSIKNVLRGLHFQKNHPQSKLVRVITGKIFDVCVDLRKESHTYGQWLGVVLSEENKNQLFVPRGFAHGFLVMSDSAEITYKCDDYYYPNDEGGIVWNDPTINIAWPLEGDFIISEKDLKWPTHVSTI